MMPVTALSDIQRRQNRINYIFQNNVIELLILDLSIFFLIRWVNRLNLIYFQLYKYIQMVIIQHSRQRETF
jgi:hypothetical protein